ncbi:MAG: hypothetical protein ACRDO2_11470 [Nocardioidaceae bacterium]
MTEDSVGRAARLALGLIRSINGGLGLFVPQVLIRRIDPQDPPSPAAVYAFRLFGVRTLLLGRELLRPPGERLDRSIAEAPLIHASDTVTATLLTVSKRVPLRSGLTLVGISGLNTVLAAVAHRRLLG